MAYGNYRPQYTSYGYGRQAPGFGYARNNEGRNFEYKPNYPARNNGNGRNYRGTPRRRSGCAMKSSYVRRATGEQVNAPVIYGWMKRYNEFISFVAVPNKNPGTKKDRWKQFVVTITPGFGKPYLTTGFWDVEKKRLSIPDLGLLCDPNAPDGGYTLKLTKRR